MIGIEIIPHVLYLLYRVFLSTFRKVIEAFTKLVFSVAECLDNLPCRSAIPLVLVTFFKYLGIFFSEEDNDWPEMDRNICIALHKRAWLARILSTDGVDAWTLD